MLEKEDNMKILVTFQIDKPFAEWYLAYSRDADARTNAGIFEVYCGHEVANSASVYCLYDVVSPETFLAFMANPENSDFASKSGQLLNTTKTVLLT